MSEMVIDTRRAIGNETVQVSRSDLFVVFMLATGHKPDPEGLTPFALERIAKAIGGCDEPEPKAVEVAERDPFDAFWEMYPRRIGKLAARKAFDKAAKDVGAPTVLRGAWDFHQHWKGQPKSRMKFIPHPATWLNQGRWDDELDAEVEHSSGSKVDATRANLTDAARQIEGGAMGFAERMAAAKQAILEAGDR